jgi:hypothetical protein
MNADHGGLAGGRGVVVTACVQAGAECGREGNAVDDPRCERAVVSVIRVGLRFTAVAPVLAKTKKY